MAGAQNGGRDRRVSLPLDGVKVLDLTSVIMGPACTQILADYGAEVVKVEPPEGDVMRHAGAKREPQMGSMFLHVNINKKSVCLDLKRAAERDRLLAAIPSYDVFIHNVRPAAMRRLGLDYESISRIKPSIIYAELTGYGQGGPYADLPAFDDIIQARTGIASLLGQNSAEGPRYLPALIADRLTGVTAAHQVLAALYKQKAIGEGGYLNVSMFETMAAFTLADHLGGRTFEPQQGPVGYSRLLTPYRRPYRTTDGYVAALVYNDKHWKAFFELIGRMDIYEGDSRFGTSAGRSENYDTIYAFLSELIAGNSTAHWLKALGDADIPCAPINDIDDLIDDPHLRAVGFFEELLNADGSRTRLLKPWPGVERPGLPPKVGQDTASFRNDADTTRT